MILTFYFLIPLIVYFFSELVKKKNIFSNYSGNLHQKFFGETHVPLIGGIFIIFFLLPLFYPNNLNIYLFLFCIFLIGFSSDIKLISSPIIRLFLQTLVTVIFIYLYEIQIVSTKIIFLDYLLSNFYFSLIFTTFCLIILMNGSNFIDGLNGLLIGYFLIILFILLKIDFLSEINLNDTRFYFIIYIFIILIAFNYLNKLYLGDAGTYLISFSVGCLLIYIYNTSNLFSPFFVVLLLWYPCFENLFSIIRKFNFKKSPISPDTKHFHQLLFIFFKNKINSKNIFINNLSSVIINLYNLIIFYLASYDITNTQYQIILILVNILIYTICYLKLFTYIFIKKN